jgi:hypothetical protein
MTACGDAAEDAGTPEGTPVAFDSTNPNQGPPPPARPPHDSGVERGTIGPPEKSFNSLVTITDDSITLSTDSLPIGQNTIVFQNKGTEVHAMELVATVGGRWRTVSLKPNGATMLTLPMMTGTYEVYCPLKHGTKEHREVARTQFTVPAG